MQTLLSSEHKQISEALSSKIIDNIESKVVQKNMLQYLSLSSREDEYLHQLLVTSCDSDFEATKDRETSAADQDC